MTGYASAANVSSTHGPSTGSPAAVTTLMSGTKNGINIGNSSGDDAPNARANSSILASIVDDTNSSILGRSLMVSMRTSCMSKAGSTMSGGAATVSSTTVSPSSNSKHPLHKLKSQLDSHLHLPLASSDKLQLEQVQEIGAAVSFFILWPEAQKTGRRTFFTHVSQKSFEHELQNQRDAPSVALPPRQPLQIQPNAYGPSAKSLQTIGVAQSGHGRSLILSASAASAAALAAATAANSSSVGSGGNKSGSSLARP
mmetsp:Transcript_101514/g.160519  ORF Transcript_101514/g.160519 Transcript_101514/m.160519 type:complete len:255 (-) Transcript_101514:2946-3710(-)